MKTAATPQTSRINRTNTQEEGERQEIKSRLSRIKHKILVLSGKGGVGKSTVAVNMAEALAHSGKRVGIMDVDFHGPTVPSLLHLENRHALVENNNIMPVEVNRLKILSIGFFLQNQDDAVIWRGPMKMGVIKQFIKDAQWGDLDYLIVDLPPGTGDEPLSICQLFEDADGGVIVTTPQHISVAAVRKSISFCKQLNLNVLGVIENMSGLVCPHCGEMIEVFTRGGGKAMAKDMNVPFLGSIPMDPAISRSGEAGKPFVSNNDNAQITENFSAIIAPILALDGT
jgi:Mrp family chromosome partitioning ATPase